MPQLIDSPVGPVHNGIGNAVSVVQVAPTATPAKDAFVTTHSNTTTINTESPVSAKVLAILNSAPINSAPAVSVTSSDASASVPLAPALIPGTSFIKSRDLSAAAQLTIKQQLLGDDPMSTPASPITLDDQSKVTATLDSLKLQLDALKAMQDDLMYGGRSGLRLNRDIVFRDLEDRLDRFQVKAPWYKRVANFFSQKFSKSSTKTNH